MKDTNDTYKDVPNFFKEYNVVISDDRNDPGQALENTIYAYIEKNELNNNVLIDKMNFKKFTYLGVDYTDLEIENEVNNYGKKFRLQLQRIYINSL